MKKIAKYLIPLIISIVVLGLGVLLYFTSAPENTLIAREILDVRKSTQRLSTNYPFSYKTTNYITLNLYTEESFENKTVTFTVYYTTTNNSYEQGTFTVNGLVAGKNLVKDKIFGSFDGSDREQRVKEITAIAAKIEGEDRSFNVADYQTTTFGRSASYLIFAGAGICVSVFAVLIAYELVSPVKNPARNVVKLTISAPNSDDEEKKKTEREIEKLKLENEQLKLQKEILEKKNKKVKCEHCGMETSDNNDVCPGCKAPLKTK